MLCCAAGVCQMAVLINQQNHVTAQVAHAIRSHAATYMHVISFSLHPRTKALRSAKLIIIVTMVRQPYQYFWLKTTISNFYHFPAMPTIS